jgi:hypothetical protein
MKLNKEILGEFNRKNMNKFLESHREDFKGTIDFISKVSILSLA